MHDIQIAFKMLSRAMGMFAESPEEHAARIVKQTTLPNGAFISTIRNDLSQGLEIHEFETAVSHPDYASGSIIIVDNYDTETLAREGHNVWEAIMGGPDMPTELVYISNYKHGHDPQNLVRYPRRATDGR